MQVPEADQFLMAERQLTKRLSVLFGRRTVELIVCSEPSSGAAKDMDKTTQFARRMVTEFGMNKSLGPVRYDQDVGMVNYLGGQTGMQEVRPQTAALIDHDIAELIDETQERATCLLETNREAPDLIASRLQKHEVISSDEIQLIAQDACQLVPVESL